MKPKGRVFRPVHWHPRHSWLYATGRHAIVNPLYWMAMDRAADRCMLYARPLRMQPERVLTMAVVACDELARYILVAGPEEDKGNAAVLSAAAAIMRRMQR